MIQQGGSGYPLLPDPAAAVRALWLAVRDFLLCSDLQRLLICYVAIAR
jgi:hypothetical protein